jgi:uncharacterized protein YgfB (UPF0149 family)
MIEPIMSDKPSEIQLPEYTSLSHDLKAAMLAVTPAELHGLLLGMLCGGLNVDDKSWQPLLFDYSNDGLAWPIAVQAKAEQLLHFSQQKLNDIEMALALLLPDREGKDGLFERSDAVAELVNHFISGLGLIALDFRTLSSEGKEALADLEEIAKLGIDEDDDLREQALLLEQVIEHVKACVLILHADHGFVAKPEDKAPTVH